MRWIADAATAAKAAIRAVGVRADRCGCGNRRRSNIASWRGFRCATGLRPRCPTCRCGWPATPSAWPLASIGVGPVRCPFPARHGGVDRRGRRACGREAVSRADRQRRHVGHVVVELDGQPCSCGGRGCVETVASGPWMTRWALANGWAGAARRRRRGLGQAAEAGDPVALQAFHRGATALAAMIASVGAVCDLDLVVIGGGVAKSGRYCSTRYARRWPATRG